MRSVSKLFYTTVLLSLTGFLMKSIGVWYNVFLADLVGTAGMGIFQLVTTVYAMAKTLAYGGMNLAATRLCIDDRESVRHSMVRVLSFCLLMGCLSMVVLWGFSEGIARVFIGSGKAGSCLRILSPSLPFVALSAGLNGYMTAAGKMSRYSLIQLAEQASKIGCAKVFTLYFGRADAMDHVSLAITLSEILSFSLALGWYLNDIRRERMGRGGKKGFFKRFIRLAAPDAFGAYLRSALGTVEHLLIPVGIRRSGLPKERAFSDYGIVQGMALPIVLYPSSIIGVLSSLLVPEIALCQINGSETRRRYMIHRVLTMTLFFSLLCSGVMTVFSAELGKVIYGSKEAGEFIRALAPLVPIMYLDMATDGMLKGLDQQMSMMRINILDSVLCVVLVFILVPKVAVEGYLITIYVAEIINFLLSFRRLSSLSTLGIRPVRHLLLPMGAVLISCGVFRAATARIPLTGPSLTLTICLSTLAYLGILRICGSIKKEDAQWFLGVAGIKKED